MKRGDPGALHRQGPGASDRMTQALRAQRHMEEGAGLVTRRDDPATEPD